MDCHLLDRDRPGPGAAAREADRRAVGRLDGRLPGRRVPAAVGGVERPVPRRDPRLLARPRPPASAPSPPGSRAPPTSTWTTGARRTPRSTSSPPTTGSRVRDLVTYEQKHNEANGEDNRDGTDNNRSWNHGRRGRDRRPGAARRTPPAGREHDGDAVPVQRRPDDHRRRRARPHPARQQQRLLPRTTRSPGSTGAPTTRGWTSTRSPRPRCGCGASTRRCGSGTGSRAGRRSAAAPRTSPGCTRPGAR